MDKEEATKILAKELGGKVGREVVLEKDHKTLLFKNALEVYQLDEPLIIESWRDGKKNKFGFGGIFKYSFKEILFLANNNANYYFLEKLSGPDRLNFAATPYALIGEKEEKDLRRLFYKDVERPIVYAFDVLGIKNFIGLYKEYSRNPEHEDTSYVHELSMDDRTLLAKFVDFVYSYRFPGSEVGRGVFGKNVMNIGELNRKLKELGIKSHISSTEYRDYCYDSNFVHRKNLDKVVNELRDRFPKEIKFQQVKQKNLESSLSKDFFNFVFSLPYEEQNIIMNQDFLRQCKDLNFVIDIMCKEYVKGKYFCEYFVGLSDRMHRRIINVLKQLPERNIHNDSFLWHQGFKDVDVDHLKLYKENAKEFIKYFKSRGVKDKKVILEDIYQCEFINEEVTDWLDAKEPKLVKEVGLQNG